MIYFYHGNDLDKGREKSLELVTSLQKKKPDASVFKMNADNFNASLLEEYIGGQGLFSNKYIVYIDRLSEKKETKDEFVSRLDDLKESENIFIVYEGKLDKATLTKIEKKAEKTVAFEISEKPEKAEYGAFALADAFAKKHKKEAWVLYRKAIDGGEAPEALHGMIFWKVKTMILSGMNSMWDSKSLLNTADELITIYHDARRGSHELETKLEAFLLKLN